MRVAVHAARFAGGVVLVLVALDSALKTFVLPRGIVVPYARFVVVCVRRLFTVAPYAPWSSDRSSRFRVAALGLRSRRSPA